MTLSPDKTALQESIIDMLNKFDEQVSDHRQVDL